MLLSRGLLLYFYFFRPTLDLTTVKNRFSAILLYTCFLSTYVEYSRLIALSLSFKSSNKNPMYYPLTRYTFLLLFHYISIHLNRKSTVILSYSNNLVYYNINMYNLNFMFYNINSLIFIRNKIANCIFRILRYLFIKFNAYKT